MELTFRFVWLDDTTLYLSAIARGDMQMNDFKELLHGVRTALGSAESSALVDLRKARWDMSAPEINAVVAAFTETGLNMNDKVALICGRDIDHFGQL
ncbi:MAG TPA: hypothetical protein VI231_12350, partial [Candidatus Binatia bacterium]